MALSWPNSYEEISVGTAIFALAVDSNNKIKCLQVNELLGADGALGDIGDSGPTGSKGFSGVIGVEEKDIGQLFIRSQNDAPTNCIICDGQSISRSSALGTLLVDEGCPYGDGDGSTTVNIPIIPPELGDFFMFIYQGSS